MHLPDSLVILKLSFHISIFNKTLVHFPQADYFCCFEKFNDYLMQHGAGSHVTLKKN